MTQPRMRRPLIDYLDSVTVLAVIGLLALVVHTVANAAMRAVGHPIEGTIELGSYWWMLMLVFLGFVTTEVRSEHVDVSLVYERVPTWIRIEYLIFGRVVSLAACAALFWFTWLEALADMEVRRASTATGIPIWPMGFMVPLGYGLLGIALVASWGRDLRKARENAHEDIQVEGPVG